MQDEEKFFKGMLEILLSLSPSHPDIKEHTSALEQLIFSAPETKHTRALKKLNRTELEQMLRFVQKPKGRHHMAEIEKMLKKCSAKESALAFIRHFYKHEGEHLPHTEGLKHL